MLVPNEKITGQVHFVYQLHPRGKGFRQPAACHDRHRYIDSRVANLVPPVVFWQPGGSLRQQGPILPGTVFRFSIAARRRVPLLESIYLRWISDVLRPAVDDLLALGARFDAASKQTNDATV